MPKGWDPSSARHLVSVSGAYTCTQIYLLLDAFWHHSSSCSLLQFDRHVKLRCVLCRSALVLNYTHPRPFLKRKRTARSGFVLFCFFKPYEVISGAAGLSRPPRCRQEGAASFSCRTAQEQAGLQPGARLLPS